MAPQISGNPSPGDTPDFRSNFLDHDHQWKAENECPGQPISKLGTDLAVGADPAWIIIRGPGNQPRPKHPQDRTKSTSFGWQCNLVRAHDGSIARANPLGNVVTPSQWANS